VIFRAFTPGGRDKGVLKYVQQFNGKKFIVATEPGILHQMEKHAPSNTYIPLPLEAARSCNECPYMKLNTMEKLYLCTKNRSPEITLSPDVIEKALISIRRMMEMS